MRLSSTGCYAWTDWMGVDMVHSGFCSNGFSSHIVDESVDSDDSDDSNNDDDDNNPSGNQDHRTAEAWC